MLVYFAADFDKVPVGGKEALGEVIVRIYKIVDEVEVQFLLPERIVLIDRAQLYIILANLGGKIVDILRRLEGGSPKGSVDLGDSGATFAGKALPKFADYFEYYRDFAKGLANFPAELAKNKAPNLSLGLVLFSSLGVRGCYSGTGRLRRMFVS